MPTLEQGRIVWAVLRSSDGTKAKRRPAVILTATPEIDPDRPFVVAVATTKFSEPLPPDHVKLPWHPQGNVRTKLREPTVVVCSWLSAIQADDVEKLGGIVPPKVMLEIMEKVTRQKS